MQYNDCQYMYSVCQITKKKKKIIHFNNNAMYLNLNIFLYLIIIENILSNSLEKILN